MKQDAFTAGGTTTSNDISISDLVHYCSSWTWRAVDALSQAQDFNADPKWISDRLNISVEVAKDALEGLIRIGVLVKSGDTYTSQDVFSFADEEQLERSDLYQIHSKIKAQVSERLSVRDCFANGIVLSNKENIRNFYNKFSALMADLNASSLNDSTCTEVYGLELSLSRLSRER